MGPSVLVDYMKLHDFTVGLFVAQGFTADHAKIIADILVEADLMGVPSHGVTRISGYNKMRESGWINPRPKVEVAKDDAALSLLDGDQGLGMVVGAHAMDLAIEKSHKYGIGSVSIRNIGHTGMAGWYPLVAARQNLVGIWINNAPRNVPPYGGLTPSLGTNPLAVSIPAGSGYPILLDISTTLVSMGQIRQAAKTMAKIPSFWGMDKFGRSTDNPQDVLDHGHLKWMGAYKGFGLSLIIELLTAVMSGGMFGQEVSPLEVFGDAPIQSSALAIVIDPARLIPIEQFLGRVDLLKKQIKDSELAPGSEEIILAGEIGFKMKEKHLLAGVPIDPKTVQELEDLALSLGVPFSLKFKNKQRAA